MPYSLAEEFLPKSKIRRSFSSDAVAQSAAEAGGTLVDARRARQRTYDDPMLLGETDATGQPLTSSDPRGVTADDIYSSTIFRPMPPVDLHDNASEGAAGRSAAAVAPAAVAPAAVSLNSSLIDNLLGSPRRATSIYDSAPSSSPYETLPDRGAPSTRQNMPDRGEPVVRQNMAAIDYSPVTQVLANRNQVVKGAPVNEHEAWARSEAQRLGIDPNKAVEVANTEGGFANGTQQNIEGAPAYSPYQLYIGGPGRPGLGDEALAAGIDPRKPEDTNRAITFALENAKKNGWTAFQGAAAHGIGQWDGISRGEAAPQALPMTGTPRVETTNYSLVDQVLNSRGANTAAQAAQAGVSAAQQTQAASKGTSVWELGKLTPNQLNQGLSEGLDRETALAICGPAAAVAFARKMGRNPTLTEATNMAKQVGWTVGKGMAGPDSEVALLKSMGVPATVEHGAPNVGKVVSSVSAGNPTIISTPGHYFVAENYDPKTGKFDFGESARVLKASKGNSWYTLDELNGLGMGAPRAALYMGGS